MKCVEEKKKFQVVYKCAGNKPLNVKLLPGYIPPPFSARFVLQSMEMTSFYQAL